MSKTSADTVRAAIKNIREGHRDKGYRALIGELFASIEHGVECAIGGHDGYSENPRTVPIIERFLEIKLNHPDFLNYLEASDTPQSLTFVSAKNFAFTELKRSQDLMNRFRFSTDPKEGDEGPFRGELLSQAARSSVEIEPEPSAEDLLIAASVNEELARMRLALESLSSNDSLLIAVLFLERRPLSDAQLEELARRRGIGPDEIRREVNQRQITQQATRVETEEQLTRLRHRALDLQHRIWILKRGFIRKDRTTPEEQQATLASLEEKQARTAELFVSAQQKLERDLPAGPHYDELAQILGLLTPSSSPADRGRVINSLTQKVLRIRSRLRNRLLQESDHDRAGGQS